MIITKEIIAEKIKAYLFHKVSLEELVLWAEDVMMNHDFDENNGNVLKNIVGLLGVSDVRSFGLTLEDCENFLSQLGYKIEFEIIEK